jgi:hypothetical protein
MLITFALTLQFSLGPHRFNRLIAAIANRLTPTTQSHLRVKIADPGSGKCRGGESEEDGVGGWGAATLSA